MFAPLLTAVTRRLTTISRHWSAFWFTPADPAPLCLIRLLAGGMTLYSHIVWGLKLDSLLGPDGFNSLELLQALPGNEWAWSFWWSVPVEWMTTVHSICLAILALFWIGCCTRVTSILALAVHVSYSNRAQFSNYGLDQITSILLLYLAIGPSGALYSVDQLIRRYFPRPRAALAGSPCPSANLALRLIQVHYCIIYFFAATAKLQGPAWWTGEAMWRAFANYEYQSTDMTWLAAYPWVLQLITHVAILWELSFAYLIWVRPLRPLMLTLGVIMHLGIGACMGMWTFGLMMIFGYIAFLEPATVRRMIALCLRRPSRSNPSLIDEPIQYQR
ncbi:MAG: HTTM domain-containing protein [Planctomycetaceae bacterium]